MNTMVSRMQQWKGNVFKAATAAFEKVVGVWAGAKPKQRRRLRLLSAFLIFFTVGMLVAAFATKNIGGNFWIVLLATSGLYFISYIVGRSGFYMMAIDAALSIPAIPPLAFVILRPPEINITAALIWLALPPLIASLMLPIRKTIFVAGSYTVFAIILGAFFTFDFITLGAIIGYMVTIAFFVITISIIHQRDQKEIETQLKERQRTEKQLKIAILKLENTNIQLQATNKELESFNYSISHDLRSPLRSIDGFIQALQENYAAGLDNQGKDYLMRLRTASKNMSDLINGILKLYGTTSGKINQEQVDLGIMGREIIDRLQATQPMRRVKFVTGDNLVAKGDPQMLRVVLENLLGNAWKFTAKTPDAKIELKRMTNGNKRTFFIRDNGAGFDMALKDKLFGAFQRLHDKKDFPGTGIGLATVQRIINRHGGGIRAEGKVGKGATFYFNFNGGIKGESDGH